MSRNSRILLISDMHIPYHHPDTFKFLGALKKKYEPTRVICLGDEVDNHAMSFHDSDPDLPSAGDELKGAIKELKHVYKMFPDVDVIDSNHGSMHYRKGKHHGIARKYLRDYADVLDAPEGWKWYNDLLVKLPNGNSLYLNHGLAKNPMKIVAARAVCYAQGHFHESFEIGYMGNPQALLWGMSCGCLVDNKALAFEYNRANLGRPIIGTGLVIDSMPKLAPMILNKRGRWNGFVP